MTEPMNDLIITRIFDVPRNLVWKAWTEPELVKRWWGPKIFAAPACRIDFRVGGKYLFCMRSDSGPEAWQKGIWSTGVYKEIVPFEKIVCTDCFADEHGNVVPGAYYGMEGFPEELVITVIFENIPAGLSAGPANPVSKTKMTLRHAGMPVQMREECRTGWSESFDKLDEFLVNVVEREINDKPAFGGKEG